MNCLSTSVKRMKKNESSILHISDFFRHFIGTTENSKKGHCLEFNEMSLAVRHGLNEQVAFIDL